MHARAYSIQSKKITRHRPRRRRSSTRSARASASSADHKSTDMSNTNNSRRIHNRGLPYQGRDRRRHALLASQGNMRPSVDTSLSVAEMARVVAAAAAAAKSSTSDTWHSHWWFRLPFILLVAFLYMDFTHLYMIIIPWSRYPLWVHATLIAWTLFSIYNYLCAMWTKTTAITRVRSFQPSLDAVNLQHLIEVSTAHDDRNKFPNGCEQLRYCCYCECFKLPDTSHRRALNACVPLFDHYCPWIANAVGFRNQHHFDRFLCSTFLLFVVYMVLIFVALWDETEMARLQSALIDEAESNGPLYIFLFSIFVAVVFQILVLVLFIATAVIRIQAGLMPFDFCAILPPSHFKFVFQSQLYAMKFTYEV